MYRSQRLLYV